jgi:hypothetical protein
MKAWCAAAAVAVTVLATAKAHAQLGEESLEGTGIPLTSLRSETGFSYMNLSLDPSVLHVPASSGGLVTGTALDVRVLSMVLGARFRVHELVDYQAWQLGSSVGFRIPIGERLHVGGDASFGYLRVASFNVHVDGAPAGTFLGARGNVDWFFRRWLSAGAVLDVEVLFLERNGARGIGLSTSLGPRVALHF